MPIEQSSNRRTAAGLASLLVAVSVVLTGCGQASLAGTSAPSAAGTASGSTNAAGSRSTGKSEIITFGVNSKTAASWPLLVAQDKGFLEQDGVTLDVFQVGNPAGLAPPATPILPV